MEMFLRPDLDPPVTESAILDAMITTHAAREQMKREHGLVVRPDGRVVPVPHASEPTARMRA
jgi:hypothetical protein